MTSIGRCAFLDCIDLTSVTIPESVTSIGESAFENCNETLVIYGKAGSYAESYARENNIEFSTGETQNPSGRKKISDNDVSLSQISYVYDGEAKTPTVTVTYTDEILEEDIDYTVDYQDNVNIGTAKVIVTGIGNYTGTVTKTFTIVQKLETDENGFVIDGNGVLTKYTGDAENVVIPDNVTRVAYYAFNECYKVKSIYIPKSVREVDWSAFAKDVGYGAFGKNYGSLENLEVAPDNPYFSSEDGVLYDKNKEKLICCPGARTGRFVVPAGVSTIGGRAFEGCRLTSIEIPAGVTRIEDTYFCRCSYELTELKVDAGNRNYSSEDGILYDKDKKTLLTCPGGKAGNIEIPAGVTSIAGFSFTCCHELRSIRIPSSVTSIGGSAFDLLLVNIIIPAEVTYIAESAISSGATIYGKEGSYAQTYAAEHNIKFSTEQSGFDIKDGVLVKYVGMDTEVVIPTGVTSIGERAFNGNRELTSVTIPAGVTTIGWDAFFHCSSLKSVTIPSSVTSIGDSAFGYYRDETWNHQKNSNFVIYGTSGSEAERYAKDNGFTFKSSGSLENISTASVALDKTSYIYDGKAKTPSVTVKLDGKTLTLNTDYTVSYSDNINAGTAKVTVTGKGNYTGSKTVNFTIAKAGQDSSITCKKTLYKVAYGTKPFKINAASKSKLTFTSSKPKIVSVDKDTGKVTIKNTGIAIITIKAGKDSVKVTVKVSPKKQAVKSVNVSKGKKLTVKWAKDKTASGYQVQISTDRKFKKGVKSKNLSKTSYTFTKLKAGKKYYVRMRSYKKSGKETLYSTWSRTKTSNKVKK